MNGVRIYAKRDDLMSLGGGGNKLRKLEFLIGDAAAKGADTIVATGGRQSNFARLTAAAAARLGLACEVVLSRMVPRSGDEYDRNGNVLLDHLFGARLHALSAGVDPTRFAEERAEELRRAGHIPMWPGSAPLRWGVSATRPARSKSRRNPMISTSTSQRLWSRTEVQEHRPDWLPVIGRSGLIRSGWDPMRCCPSPPPLH